MARIVIPHDLGVFAALPVRFVRCGGGLDIAVHVSGRFGGGRLPIVCVSGYARNMSDFTDFAAAMRARLGADQPLVLIDLPGRGRSGWRRDKRTYTVGHDAETLAVVVAALGLDRAVFCGLGHGGQVVMAFGVLRPGAIAGAVLVDASPVPDPRGLVHQHANLAHLATVSSEAQASAAAQADSRRPLSAHRHHPRSTGWPQRSHAIAGRRTPLPLFDPALIAQLAGFSPSDVFEPQWQLFDTLRHAALMLVRTELTELLRAETFAEMARRRPDARTLTIPNQGSPALLDGAAENDAIAAFVREAEGRSGSAAAADADPRHPRRAPALTEPVIAGAAKKRGAPESDEGRKRACLSPPHAGNDVGPQRRVREASPSSSRDLIPGPNGTCGLRKRGLDFGVKPRNDRRREQWRVLLLILRCERSEPQRTRPLYVQLPSFPRRRESSRRKSLREKLFCSADASRWIPAFAGMTP